MTKHIRQRRKKTTRVPRTLRDYVHYYRSRGRTPEEIAECRQTSLERVMQHWDSYDPTEWRMCAECGGHPTARDQAEGLTFCGCGFGEDHDPSKGRYLCSDCLLAGCHESDWYPFIAALMDGGVPDRMTLHDHIEAGEGYRMGRATGQTTFTID